MKPDPDFSPARNNKVIEDSIKKYHRNKLRLEKIYEDQLAERVDAVASYWLHLGEGKDTSVEKYFGKHELERLQGRKLVRVVEGAKRHLGWTQ